MVRVRAILGTLLVVAGFVVALCFGLYAVGGFAGLHRSLDAHMFSLTATNEIRELTWTWVLATAGTLDQAAKTLGIDASTLYRKRKQYNL